MNFPSTPYTKCIPAVRCTEFKSVLVCLIFFLLRRGDGNILFNEPKIVRKEKIQYIYTQRLTVKKEIFLIEKNILNKNSFVCVSSGICRLLVLITTSTWVPS